MYVKFVEYIMSFKMVLGIVSKIAEMLDRIFWNFWIQIWIFMWKNCIRLPDFLYLARQTKIFEKSIEIRILWEWWIKGICVYHEKIGFRLFKFMLWYTGRKYFSYIFSTAKRNLESIFVKGYFLKNRNR